MDIGEIKGPNLDPAEYTVGVPYVKMPKFLRTEHGIFEVKEWTTSTNDKSETVVTAKVKGVEHGHR